MHVTQWLATYGYGAVLLDVAIESTGIPFPGETMLLVAAIAAGTTHQLVIFWVIVAAASGAILSDQLGYWFGATGGASFLLRSNSTSTQTISSAPGKTAYHTIGNAMPGMMP